MSKTLEELKKTAIQIRDELKDKQNSAFRIGTQLLEQIENLETDYYKKMEVDKEVQDSEERSNAALSKVNTEVSKLDKEVNGTAFLNVTHLQKISNYELLEKPIPAGSEVSIEFLNATASEVFLKESPESSVHKMLVEGKTFTFDMDMKYCKTTQGSEFKISVKYSDSNSLIAGVKKLSDSQKKHDDSIKALDEKVKALENKKIEADKILDLTSPNAVANSVVTKEFKSINDILEGVPGGFEFVHKQKTNDYEELPKILPANSEITLTMNNEVAKEVFFKNNLSGKYYGFQDGSTRSIAEDLKYCKTTQGSEFKISVKISGSSTGVIGTIETLKEKDNTHDVEIEGLKTRVQNIENNGSSGGGGGGGGTAPTQNVKVQLPKVIYGVVNDTLQIFYRSIIRAVNPYLYSINCVCSGAKPFNRYLEFTPKKSGNTSLSVIVRNNNLSEIGKCTSQLVVSDLPASPSRSLNVLCVGASTTESGAWPAELNRRLTSRDGTPVGLGLTNIKFVGRKLASGVYVEATGGWSWDIYTSNGERAIRFQTTAIDSIVIGDIVAYTDADGVTGHLRVEEINATEGVGNVRCTWFFDSATKKLPRDTSGVLKGLYHEERTLSYSSFSEENFSPFVNSSGNMDFKPYADKYCNGKIDIMCIYLTAFNSGKMGNDPMDSVKVSMKKYLDGLFKDFPECKVIINTGALASQNGGIEYISGASAKSYTYASTYMYFNYNRVAEEIADMYPGKVYLADVCGQTDSEYVMKTTTKAVNTRCSETEIIGVNNVHPKTEGYLQYADSMYRAFVYVLKQYFN